ncbi:SGNH hydrolase [Amycolatopsis balhimycina DSM 5908]|uniref:SGNH hydrolase n=1 Tax=Amycolatopsis balhimycina DSM 5908 TaxID=1081091 RepID=A0A428WM55_AMYBA|nr:SGNH/GDSL hydrolase family protein [Amycolatopsis balhimycina]RSM44177.1 SGNH hydrolase [Amycolatopsis balhimycina DSM 5908]
MHRFLGYCALVLTALVAVLTVPTAAAAAAPVRIMALGDSITGSPGCWRALLWRHLQSTGHTNTDFVGTLPAPGCGFAYDGENEGHGGYLATGIANNNQLPGWLGATRPDIVLMHLGTNDIWSNIGTTTILDAYSRLLGQMRASNPAMKVLVAKILPMNPANCAACGRRVVDLDNAIPGWAQAHSTAASPITVVDQWTGFSTSADTVDGVHPNSTTGIQKMESRWYPALTAALGGGSTPTGATVVGGQSGRCLDVTGAGTANGTKLQLWDCNGQSNQAWTFGSAGEIRGGSGRCLDAAGQGTSPGTAVDIWDCTGQANQQWTLNADGSITGRQSGLCLDASGQQTANGTPVALWTCNGQANQRWSRR